MNSLKTNLELNSEEEIFRLINFLTENKNKKIVIGQNRGGEVSWSGNDMTYPIGYTFYTKEHE